MFASLTEVMVSITAKPFAPATNLAYQVKQQPYIARLRVCVEVDVSTDMMNVQNKGTS